MIKLLAIRNSKRLASSVLFFYSMLYLCMIFHFHPVAISSENHLLLENSNAVSVQSNNLHCEICHINSSFSQIPVLLANDFKSGLIKSIVSTAQEFSLHNYSGISKQLRAPPTV